MTRNSTSHDTKGPIAWMAGNSVTANLLMAVLLIGGLYMGFNIKQEVFPEFSLDMINISIAYPGASPEEVEKGILLAVEEAIQGIEGIDEITASALEGHGSLTVKALEGTDINRLWQEIKSEVDRIGTFPDESEDPRITIAERKREVLKLALYGDASEESMRTLAEQVRDQLLLDSGITVVELEGVRDREIHIEISQQTLRRYGVTLQDVAERISRASVELGAGGIKSSGGEVLLRIKDQRDYAKQYAALPVIILEDGSKVLLEDIATIDEGFEESDNWASFNGKRAVIIEIYRVGEQTPTQVASKGKALAKQINKSLPSGIHLTVLRDLSKIFAQRADLLLRNAYIGLGLVFFFLALFLEIRLAFWVSLGIPISFLGSFLLLAPTDFSINIVSMFAFIVTLGIVVDDAVVVGENIYFCRRQGMPFSDAAVKGVKTVAMPVVFSVLTNMVAFVPLMFVPGFMGKIFQTIPVVVIAVFAISLIECFFILPAHLSHSRERPLFFPLNYLEKWQERFSLAFETGVRKYYGALLFKLLDYRYSVIAFGIALLMTVAGYVSSGQMGMVLFPRVESDYAFCQAVLPYGVSEKKIKTVEQLLVKKAHEVIFEATGKKIGEAGKNPLSKGVFSKVQDNKITVRIFLTSPDKRPLSTAEVIKFWREKTGKIPILDTITFESNRGGPGSGKNLTISLSHKDNNILNRAGESLAKSLSDYSIVHDIDDGSAKGKKQFDISLNAAGRRMGLSSREVANQVRHAFQGVTAVKNQRGSSEVSLKIRLPKEERVSLSSFEELVLSAPAGEILLRDAVNIVEKRAYTSIKRTDGRREILVTANVKPASRAGNILNDMKQQTLPDLMNKIPGLSYGFKGHKADTKESVTALLKGLGMALLCIFFLLAVPFKSYLQPFIIMFCIPFGVIGAIIGHIVMGYSLSVMSLFGIVAMSGVVVNDSLVLIDFANRQCRKGVSALYAVHFAGIQRFRPILLTTLTTCGGLAPIITETSRQARFLIPMAISLGFGILFATFITLVMVPCLYMILEDIKTLYGQQDAEISSVEAGTKS